MRTCQRGKPGRLRKPAPRNPQSQIGIAREMNIAPPEDNFAPPPGRNSHNLAPLPHANRPAANNLRGHGGAKFAEIRPTKKRKNFSEAKTMSVSNYLPFLCALAPLRENIKAS